MDINTHFISIIMKMMKQFFMMSIFHLNQNLQASANRLHQSRKFQQHFVAPFFLSVEIINNCPQKAFLLEVLLRNHAQNRGHLVLMRQGIPHEQLRMDEGGQVRLWHGSVLVKCQSKNSQLLIVLSQINMPRHKVNHQQINLNKLCRRCHCYRPWALISH